MNLQPHIQSTPGPELQVLHLGGDFYPRAGILIHLMTFFNITRHPWINRQKTTDLSYPDLYLADNMVYKVIENQPVIVTF